MRSARTDRSRSTSRSWSSARRQRAIVLGKGGARIKEIGARARAELAEHHGRQVHLYLHVKVKPGWDEDRESIARSGWTGWNDRDPRRRWQAHRGLTHRREPGHRAPSDASAPPPLARIQNLRPPMPAPARPPARAGVSANQTLPADGSRFSSSVSRAVIARGLHEAGGGIDRARRADRDEQIARPPAPPRSAPSRRASRRRTRCRAASAGAPQRRAARARRQDRPAHGVARAARGAQRRFAARHACGAAASPRPARADRRHSA